jgi:hypothetical protein
MSVRGCIQSMIIVVVLMLAVYDDASSQSKYLIRRQKELAAAKDLYERSLQENFSVLKENVSQEYLADIAATKLFITMDDDLVFARAFPGQNVIQLSAATIVFIEQLAVTRAWFEASGVSEDQPIINYVLLTRKNIREDDARRAVLPSMAKALSVPDDEIWSRNESDPTKTYANNFLKSAVTWIVAHEMGHLALGHQVVVPPGMSMVARAERMRIQEAEADNFATGLMLRVRLAPIGMAVTMLYYSLLFPIRMECSSEEEWQNYVAEASHPLWPERLKSIGDVLAESDVTLVVGVNNAEIAEQLRSIASLLSERDMLDAQVLGSEGLTLKNIRTYVPLEHVDKKYYHPRDDENE